MADGRGGLSVCRPARATFPPARGLGGLDPSGPAAEDSDPMGDGKKIVWSLGAPLLEHLLTVRSAERVHAAYSGKKFLSALDLKRVAVVCKAGMEEDQWKNAEELIEHLHLAVSSKAVCSFSVKRTFVSA